ncbi:rod-determining factor RdfA [Halorarius litoreus]|uniref:rod-determining factor RdfA n=1 Tax=Halorarius litoreus TaxID=2962676 RepID=UPI0020CE4C56|nr:rod-determining factor RdfA [Halorarius litoreus]
MSDAGNDADGTDVPHTNSKVGRLIEEYGLDGRGAWLEERWTTDGTSLRDLADEFNQLLLEAAMRDAGMDPLDHDVAGTYEMLTDETTSSGSRVELRNRLEWDGVDVEALEADFVSHQAIHTYLRKFREAERQEPDVDPRASAQDTIERLQGRTKAVATDTLSRLANGGDLTLDEFDVLVDVRVICSNCGTQYQLPDLLEQGGCDCQ